MSIDGLPVMGDTPRVFANQVRLELSHRFGARLAPTFGDRFADPDDAGVGVNFEIKSAAIEDKILELADLQLVPGVDQRFVTGCGHGLSL